MRPAHIHFYVQAEGYQPLITQIYDSACQYVENDAVFAVKDSLVVDFKDAGENKAELEV
jgi:catechol 1,2-dioxygenase